MVTKNNPEISQFYKAESGSDLSEPATLGTIHFGDEEGLEKTEIAEPEGRFHWRSELETKKSISNDSAEQVYPVGKRHLLKGVGKNQLSLQDTDDNILWTLQLKTEAISIDEQLITDKSIYLRLNDSQVLAVDLATGRMKWQTQFNYREIKSLHTSDDRLFIVVSDDDSATNPEAFEKLIEVDTLTGKTQTISPIIGYLNHLKIKVKNDDEIYGVNDKNYYFIWNQKEKVISSKTLLHEKAITPVTYVGPYLFFATSEESFLYKFNMETLEMEWNVDVRFKVGKAPQYLEHHNIVLAVSETGYVQAFDARKGESQWRYNFRNQNSVDEPQLVRLGATGIRKFELGWRYKGYVMAIPCRQGRICLVNPQKGQLLSSLNFHVQDIISQPQFNDSWSWAIGKDETEGIKLVKIIENPVNSKPRTTVSE
tara:strand:+ start:47097 stop:48371 length:1275 start_codon:yes stop_codon:yes gene_type:complete